MRSTKTRVPGKLPRRTAQDCVIVPWVYSVPLMPPSVNRAIWSWKIAFSSRMPMRRHVLSSTRNLTYFSKSLCQSGSLYLLQRDVASELLKEIYSARLTRKRCAKHICRMLLAAPLQHPRSTLQHPCRDPVCLTLPSDPPAHCCASA